MCKIDTGDRHKYAKETVQSLVKQLEHVCTLYDMPFVCVVQTDIDGDNVLHTAASYIEADSPTSETVCAMYDELMKITP